MRSLGTVAEREARVLSRERSSPVTRELDYRFGCHEDSRRVPIRDSGHERWGNPREGRVGKPVEILRVLHRLGDRPTLAGEVQNTARFAVRDGQGEIAVDRKAAAQGRGIRRLASQAPVIEVEHRKFGIGAGVANDRPSVAGREGLIAARCHGHFFRVEVAPRVYLDWYGDVGGGGVAVHIQHAVPIVGRRDVYVPLDLEARKGLHRKTHPLPSVAQCPVGAAVV